MLSLYGIALAVLFLLVKNIIPLLHCIWRHFKTTRLLKNTSYLRSLGKWAVITGGTDGIGLEYAKQLAHIGINLILVSRSKAKLLQVSSDIQTSSGVVVQIIEADFTDPRIYPNIETRIQQITGPEDTVGILINNVGMTQDFPHEFYNYHGDVAFYTRLIHCNMLSVVQMTQMYFHLRQTCAQPNNPSSRHRKGLIINIASASSLNPIPMSAMYSSSKRFVAEYSRGLQRELQGSSVRVHLVLPFFVRTKFIGKFSPPSWLAPDAQSYVKETLAKAGVEKESFGTLSHELQVWFYSIPPSSFTMTMAARVHKKRQQILMANRS